MTMLKDFLVSYRVKDFIVEYYLSVLFRMQALKVFLTATISTY